MDQVQNVDILIVGSYRGCSSGRATAAIQHQTSLRPCTVPRSMREAVQECSQELQGLSAFAERGAMISLTVISLADLVSCLFRSPKNNTNTSFLPRQASRPPCARAPSRAGCVRRCMRAVRGFRWVTGQNRTGDQTFTGNQSYVHIHIYTYP